MVLYFASPATQAGKLCKSLPSFIIMNQPLLAAMLSLMPILITTDPDASRRPIQYWTHCNQRNIPQQPTALRWHRFQHSIQLWHIYIYRSSNHRCCPRQHHSKISLCRQDKPRGPFVSFEAGYWIAFQGVLLTCITVTVELENIGKVVP